MDSEETIKIHGTKRRVEAAGADLSGSSFTDVNLSGATFTDVDLARAKVENANLSGLRVRNVNLSGLQISAADLRRASIEDSLMESMTIDGIPVAELIAAYGALNAKDE